VGFASPPHDGFAFVLWGNQTIGRPIGPHAGRESQTAEAKVLFVTDSAQKPDQADTNVGY
jgi:hypothetical protein